MLASSIGWILIVSGAATAAAGLISFLFPKPFFALYVGKTLESSTELFVRHWGVLIFVIGALLVNSAYAPSTRTPVLTAAAIEKFVNVALTFFGPVKRTTPMTVIAIVDGVFTILYVAYLAGL